MTVVARRRGGTGVAGVTAPGPTPATMLRSIRSVLGDPLAYLRGCVTEHGPVVALPMWRGAALLVDDPAGVRRVLQDNHRNYTKHTFQYSALALVTGDGLLTSDGPTWRTHRRLVQPAFHRDCLAHVAAEAVRCARLAGAELDSAGGAPVDTDPLLMRATLDVVGRVLLGADLVDGGQADGRELVAAVHDALDGVMRRAMRPWEAPPGVVTPLSRRLARANDRLDTAVERVVEARRGAPGGADVLGLLLGAGEALSAREVRDELVTLVIAGHETVASSLVWTLRLVAEHPQAQAAVHDELDRLLDGPAGRPPEWADLAALPVTRAAVDEGLRLYPPAWLISRRAVADDEVAGVPVPAGTLVLTSPWLQHRRPELWPEADRFDLSRWTDGPARAAREGYLPFGAGPRLCIGRDFAIAESVLVLAELLRTRRVAPVGPRPAATAGVTLRARGGSPLAVRPR
ncbi:MAG: cytochrome P450 [Kineosporiaceae bacterium]